MPRSDPRSDLKMERGTARIPISVYLGLLNGRMSNAAFEFSKLIMKGIILLLLCIVYSASGSELYRALNISCYEKDELMCDPMDTSTAKAKVDDIAI